MFRNNMYVSLILLCMVVQGCRSFQDPEQQVWHDKMDRTYLVVESAAEENIPISKEQLVALLGEPDLRLSPLEFNERLIPLRTSRTRIMRHIWSGYCLAKRDAGQLDCDPQGDDWKKCEDFKRSSVWVYDESRHFAKPLDHGDWLHCVFCRKPAFVSFFFLVEDANVIGSVPLLHDEPMRALFTNRSEK